MTRFFVILISVSFSLPVALLGALVGLVQGLANGWHCFRFLLEADDNYKASLRAWKERGFVPHEDFFKESSLSKAATARQPSAAQANTAPSHPQAGNALEWIAK